jgi:hypothetical protein
MSHCSFISHMKSSFHSLVPFLPLFRNCQFRRLDSVQFLCSQAHILAGRCPETRLVTPRLLLSTLSQSQSHIVTDGQSVSKSWCRAPSGSHDQIFITFWLLRSCFCGAPSLTGGRVCLLYMLLSLASAVFLGSEFRVTRNHILLFQIWDFAFRRLLRLAGSRWRYSTPSSHG